MYVNGKVVSVETISGIVRYEGEWWNGCIQV
jgi:hypothetical protein